MFKAAVYLLLLACIVVFQIKQFNRKGLGSGKDIWLYCILMGTAGVLGALLNADVDVPSPAGALHDVFSPVGRFLFPD